MPWATRWAIPSGSRLTADLRGKFVKSVFYTGVTHFPPCLVGPLIIMPPQCDPIIHWLDPHKGDPANCGTSSQGCFCSIE